MNTRNHKTQSAIFISIAFLILVLGGCSAPKQSPATTGPGAPDMIQSENYEMLGSAIAANSEKDALKAVSRLQSDVSRWETDASIKVDAMNDLVTLKDIIESKNWDLATKMYLNLTAKYRQY